MDLNINRIIKKYTIKNAKEYKKADAISVLNKVISIIKINKLDYDFFILKKEVNKTVEAINKLDRNEIEKEYIEYNKEFKEEYEKKAKQSVPKFILEGAIENNFATRFPPEPNGYLHLGHAKQIFLEQEFIKIYKGKFFLFFDDTNPEKEKQEYIDNIKKDLKWLGIKFDREYYASDFINEIYTFARQLIKNKKAYACTCKLDIIKYNRFNGIECEHRKNEIKFNLEIFEDMLKGKYNEGECIIRFSGDLKSQNTTLRDPTLLRIKKFPHYRQKNKYIVWPTYDLNTPILDSINGVTDTIRGKEYELRDELYKKILKALNLRVPRTHLESRLTIKNNTTSKRELNALINEKLILSYSDPRLVTIAGLRSRGIQPEAIKIFSLRFGMSKTDSIVDISLLLDENKKLIDSYAKRLFFVANPIKLIINNFNSNEIKLKIKLHPNKNLGFREIEIKDNIFYISKNDALKLKTNEIIYLKDFHNIIVKQINKNEIYTDLIDNNKNRKYKTIQWVSNNNYININVIIPKDLLKNNKFNSESLEIENGFAEKYILKLNKKNIVQFERFGFCILNNNDNNKFEFIFISN